MERNLPAVLAYPPSPVPVTALAASDLFTTPINHGFNAGDTIFFTSLTGGAGLSTTVAMFVIASGLTTNQFRVSATSGGSTVDITSDLTAGFATKVNALTSITATGDLATAANAHGLSAGDSVTFSALVAGAGITAGTVYYVIATGLTTTAFKVSTTFGGSALDITTDYTSANFVKVLNWNNCKSIFTNDQLGWLAKYFETSGQGDLASGSVVDNNVLRNYYQTATLPL